MPKDARRVLENARNGSNKTLNTEVIAALEAQVAQNDKLAEALTQVQAQLQNEDVGWLKLGELGGGDEPGLSLDDLKDWSKEITAALAGTPVLKSGAKLRSSYVWNGGVTYSGIPNETRGRGKNPQKVIDNPINQLKFFGAQAREEREECLFTDGFVLYLYDTEAKEIRPVSLHEITALYKNPEYQDEVWAYRRTWTDGNDPTAQPKVEWYFTDIFESKRVATITNGANEPETVSQTIVAFDGVVNSHVGWAMGVPDALAALVWWRKYRDAMLDGTAVTASMATFAFKAIAGTPNAGNNASVKIASGNAAGSTYVAGQSNDLVPLSTAGRGYDFDSARPIAALVAASLEVSVVALLRDPGAAGSSYGSASTLDLPTRLAVEARRQWHIDLEKRVLRYIGAPDAEVTFKNLDDATSVYRELQAVILGWTSGLLHEDEVRDTIIRLLEITTDKTSAPDGVLLPNNSRSLPRNDIDTDASGGNSTTSSTSSSSPGQGQNSPAGGGPVGNDTRTDIISNSAQAQVTAMKAQIAEMQKIIDEMEAKI